MKNVDSDEIKKILEIQEITLNLEKQEIQEKINNLKRIDLETFTSEVQEGIDEGIYYDLASIIYLVNQIIKD